MCFKVFQYRENFSKKENFYFYIIIMSILIFLYYKFLSSEQKNVYNVL